ncbi:Transporter [invertebrate metagenome]|uniref:Transporter n=1 Tax=invertebrate metagenome TaxID=1711999 RepID=A0A484H5T6_9ZZZZ
MRLSMLLRKTALHSRIGLVSRLRAYFFAGVLVTAPAAITFYVAWLVIDFVDRQVTPWLPPRYNPETYLPFGLPGLGLLILVFGLTAIGALTAGFLGNILIRTGERILARMPVIRSIYSATKQIFETVLRQQSTAFREVVLLEYPRRGLWTIGFITAPAADEIHRLLSSEMANVFVPTTPNPTSGFLLFVPRADLIQLSMTVEEGIKMVVSGGIVTPPDHRATQTLSGGDPSHSPMASRIPG